MAAAPQTLPPGLPALGRSGPDHSHRPRAFHRSRSLVSDALRAGRVQPAFQPIVRLPERQVVGFEALARLWDGHGRAVPPTRFIPLAEEGREIVEVGAAMLGQAVAAAAAWRAGVPALATATVSVNVAAAQLELPGFPAFVRSLLLAEGLPASALVLEITESAAATERVRAGLESLAMLGVRIAVDDFGIGFANLDQLRRLPVHVLKLDRSFVSGVTRTSADRAIVKVAVDLAYQLGMTVVAEGVETVAQADLLTDLGCRLAQGFLFAAAGPDPAAVAASVAVHRREPGAGQPPSDVPWPAETGLALLSVAHLLCAGEDRVRGGVHAVATGLARGADVPARAAHVASRLALVHDVGRLAVDGQLPESLRHEPTVLALAGLGRFPPGADGLGVRIALLARHVLAEAADADPALGATALAGACRRALLTPPRGYRLNATLRAALVRVAQSPPDVLPGRDVVTELLARQARHRGLAERLRTFTELLRGLAGSRDTRELLRVALEEARRLVGAAAVSIERWHLDTGDVRCLVSVGELGPGEQPFPDDECYDLGGDVLTRRMSRGGVPSIVTLGDEAVHPQEVEWLRRTRKGSAAAVPVYLEDRIWGHLWFTTGVDEPRFANSDIELLTAVATLMSGVVAQAENLDRMNRLAFQDPLTRLANRRAVDDALAAIEAEGGPVTLALIDVDGLKVLNDRWGHMHGDVVLCALAERLAAGFAASPGTVVGRLGGDEFAVVRPGPDGGRVAGELERARGDLVEAFGVSFSFGVASASSGWTRRDLLAAADTTLYAAKPRPR